MPKFDVEIVRIGYGFETVQVEASTQEEAEGMALDHAGDLYYDEKESEYEINAVWPVKEEEITDKPEDLLVKKIHLEQCLVILRNMRRQQERVLGDRYKSCDMLQDLVTVTAAELDSVKSKIPNDEPEIHVVRLTTEDRLRFLLELLIEYFMEKEENTIDVARDHRMIYRLVAIKNGGAEPTEEQLKWAREAIHKRDSEKVVERIKE